MTDGTEIPRKLQIIYSYLERRMADRGQKGDRGEAHPQVARRRRGDGLRRPPGPADAHPPVRAAPRPPQATHRIQECGSTQGISARAAHGGGGGRGGLAGFSGGGDRTSMLKGSQWVICLICSTFMLQGSSIWMGVNGQGCH